MNILTGIDESILLELSLVIDPAGAPAAQLQAFIGALHTCMPGITAGICCEAPHAPQNQLGNLISLSQAFTSSIPIDAREIFPLPGIGSLFLTGVVPVFTPIHRTLFQRLLQRFAASVLNALGMQAQQRQAKHQAALAHFAGTGCWTQSPDSDSLVLDVGLCKLMMMESSVCLLEDFLQRVDPVDCEGLRLQFEAFQFAGHDETSEFSFRLRLPNGNSRRLAGQLIWLNDGTDFHIAGLVHDATEVELARTESLYRSKLEHLLTTLSMRLINAPSEQFDAITHEALAEVGRYVGADRAYRFRYEFEAGIVINTHEWCAEGILPEIDNLQATPLDALEFWVSAHKRGMPLHYRRISDLPPEHALRKILEPQGVQSIITLPLLEGDQCIGFIGFDAVRHERHWSDVDMTLLKLLAKLLVNAEQRLSHERTLRDVNHKLEESKLRAEALALKANTASEAKSRFVATISHEIRTPLHAILGFAEMLLQKSAHAEQGLHLEYVRQIRDSGEMLQALVNDVLDFSRIESEQLPLHFSDVVLKDFMQGVLHMFEALARSKRLALVLEISPLCPEFIHVDDLRLRQLLNNIVGNAVKFTNAGEIRIAVSCEATSCDALELRIRVSDTGIGIAPEHLPRLFDAFFQADNGDDRVYSGTGLGLTIADMLARLMRGSIEVESTLGKGSTFTVRLPLAVGTNAAARLPKKSVKYDLRGLRVLLAEDNSINRAMVLLHLKEQGCEAVTAENGLKACEHFAEMAFDLVLMDCQMPVMDGYAAARSIRLLESQRGTRTPILAVTASAFQGEKEQCLAAGMDDVLIKPYSRDEFIAMIARWGRPLL